MEYVKLGEIGKIVTGNTPSKKEKKYYSENYIDFVKPTNFKNNEITYINKGEEFLSLEGMQEGRVAGSNSVLITCIWNIGNIGLLNKKVCFNQQINSIEIDNGKVFKEYVAYALQSIVPVLRHNANKAVVPILNKSQLEKIKIPICNLEKQKRIIDKLNIVRRIIKKQKNQLKLLEDLSKSLFYEMFGDPIRNEKVWEVKKLSEFSDIKSGGTPSTKNKEYWENGNISWIGSNMCQNRVIYENDGKFITQKGLENSSAKVFEKDVILIALVGATIGKVALLKFLTTTNQNIAGIKILDNKRYKSEYIFYILQFLYPKFQKLGGDKFKMANLSFIKNLTILDVSYTLQNKFAKKVEKIDKLKFEIEQSLKETENLYNSLMQKFF